MPNFGGGYAMNPAKARQMAGGQQQPAAGPDDDQDQEQDEQEQQPGADPTPMGTAATGYAQGPADCGNCIHFDGQGECEHPVVEADPEVNGKVQAGMWCHFFRAGGDQSQPAQGAQSATDNGKPQLINIA